MARWFKVSLINLVVLCLLAIVLELVFFGFYSTHNDRLKADRSLFPTDSYLESMGMEGCSMMAMLAPHPLFGFYYHNQSHCRRPSRNNYGLVGRDLELKKNPNFYNVLVLGGSVSESLATHQSGGQFVLERELNEHWQSPTKKPFRILNGAEIAAGQPMQLAQTLMFSDLADAAISIEGYNEYFGFHFGYRIDAAPLPWLAFAVKAQNPLLSFAMDNLASVMRSKSWTWLTRWHLTLFVAATLTRNFQASWWKIAIQNQPFPTFPKEWGDADKKSYYLDRYRYFLRMLNGIYTQAGKPFLLFIAPAPGFYKSLTEEERGRIMADKFEAKEYERIFTFLEDLQQTEVAHESLLKIYENHPETIYVDNIHPNDSGLEIMARELATRLAKRNGWKRKN